MPKDKTPRKHTITEAATVTLNSDDFRRVAPDLHRAVNIAAEALKNEDANERDRLRAIVDAASTGLFSLAIGLDPPARKP